MNLIWKEILNKTFTGKQKSRSYSNDQNKFDINARIDRAYTLRKKKILRYPIIEWVKVGM